MMGILCRGNMVLIGLCLLDMISTLILTTRGATEANPVMAYFLHQGAWHFVIAKLASFIPAVVALEWYYRRQPAKAETVIRAAIWLYVLLYGIAFYRVNFARI